MGGSDKHPFEDLDRLKREINLVEYAVTSFGYIVDDKSSSKTLTMLRHFNDDKIAISLGQSGIWIYCSNRDATDKGTIIDFHQRRTGHTLRDTITAISNWSGTAAPVRADLPTPKVEPKAAVDIDSVRNMISKMHSVIAHPYLESRSIFGSLINPDRFRDRIYIDHRKNAVFPHINRDGICGFEIKNHTFTGFSKGGTKGLWCSRAFNVDDTLVVTESAIDALSFSAVNSSSTTRYISTAGSIRDEQLELLTSAINKLPANGRLILATDNDQGGDKLAIYLRDAAQAIRQDVIVTRHVPESGKDWNDYLREQTKKNQSSEKQIHR